MRIKSLIKSKKVLIIVLTLVFLVMSLFLPNVVFAGEGNINDGTPKMLNLNLLLMYDAGQEDIDAWEEAFNRTSELLYNSTEGQMQIGTVNVYIDKSFTKYRADVWVEDKDSGVANADRLGLDGSGRILIHQEDKSDKGQVTIVHELGHYVFGLWDEYQNVLVDENREPVKDPDTGKLIETDDGYCTSEDPDAPASLMDAGGFVRNHRTEWCTPAGTDWSTAHNNEFYIDGENLYLNEQEALNQKSCWETIVDICKNKYGITLTLPTSEPSTDLPSGHEDINWNIVGGLSRAVIAIDRSGSMLGEKIRLAKLGGSIFVNLVHTGEELGVVSFASSPSVNFPLQKVADGSTKEAAQNAINAISAGGTTNIGGGLRTSLNQIVGAGEPTGNEFIVLLSNGMHNTGENPSRVIPDLQARGVRVFTIGLGADAHIEMLQNIAQETGGKFFFAKTEDDLCSIFISIAAELSGGDIINLIEDYITSSEQITRSVYVDTFNKEATFTLEWGGSDLDLTLQRPDGTVVNPAVAQTDPDIEYVERDNYEFYRIQKPMAGEWQLIIDAVDVTGQESFTAQVLGETLGVIFNVYTDKAQYTYPESILIQADVIAIDYVANAEVTGTVVRPDGSTVGTTLFDDGLESHGDEFPDDGVYSNFFSTYTEDGVYTFNMVVDNKIGIQASGSFEIPPEGWTPEPISPFTREAGVSVYVSGVPLLQANIDFYPDTLNLKTKGNWITAYIELPAGWDAADIDLSSVLLNGVVPAVSDPKYGFVTDPNSYITDRDGDGIPERMVKFDGEAVKQLINVKEDLKDAPGGLQGEVQFTVSGSVKGVQFEGNSTILVILKGK